MMTEAARQQARTSSASTPVYADYVHPLCEQAFQQGFKGQIISCTADFYQKIIEKTSKEFMEGFIFQFPDFDDPKLNEPQHQLPEAERVLCGVREALRRGRVERGLLGIRLDHGAVVGRPRRRPASPSRQPCSTAMKEGGKGKHIFGDAEWWGKELFGIDNALVGNWPVVVIEDGKAKIKQYRRSPPGGTSTRIS